MVTRCANRVWRRSVGASSLVSDVDVGVAGCAEHHRVPRCLPTEAVARGILLVVRLDLDDPPADAVDEERHADQVGSDLVDGASKESARKTRARGRRRNS